MAASPVQLSESPCGSNPLQLLYYLIKLTSRNTFRIPLRIEPSAIAARTPISSNRESTFRIPLRIEPSAIYLYELERGKRAILSESPCGSNPLQFAVSR